MTKPIAKPKTVGKDFSVLKPEEEQQMSNDAEIIYVTLAISQRDEGLRIRAMAPYEEAYISGTNKDNVFSDIGHVLQTILRENHGVKWAKD